MTSRARFQAWPIRRSGNIVSNANCAFSAALVAGVFGTRLLPSVRLDLSFEAEWGQAAQTEVVFSFTIVHHAAHPSMKAIVPYNVAIIDFPECGHVRLVSNVIDADPTTLRIGMPVALIWEMAGNGMLVPRFHTID